MCSVMMGRGQGNEMIKLENSCNLCFLITPPPPPFLCHPLSLSLSGFVCLSSLTHMYTHTHTCTHALSLSLSLMYTHTCNHTHRDGERETWAVFFKLLIIEYKGKLIILYHIHKHLCCRDQHEMFSVGLFIQPHSVMLMTACFIEHVSSPTRNIT